MINPGLVGYSSFEKPSPNANANIVSWEDMPLTCATGNTSGINRNALALPEAINISSTKNIKYINRIIDHFGILTVTDIM